MEKTIKIPKFDHNAKDIAKCFGLSLYQKQFISHAIIFAILSNKMIAEHLFDDPKDAPDDLITFSGQLEKALSLVDNDLERAFLLVVYQSAHTSVNFQLFLQKDMENEEPKKKGSIEDTMKTLIGQLLTSSLDKAKQYIKEVNYDFEKYISKACPRDKEAEIEADMEKSERDKETDDLLKGLFGNDMDDFDPNDDNDY